ncbi:MAG: glycerophosphodiester phosphodiesterase family protein [Pseudomonadota bacterium]
MRAALALTAISLAAACGEAVVPETVRLDPTGYATAGAFLSCFEDKAPLVSAHRGGPAPGYPENTIEAFENTLAQVPALIETDVRATRDGEFVLFHDDDVKRLTGAEGEVADMTLAELKALRLIDMNGRQTDFQIPTLDEALEAMRGRTVLQLDVKRGVSLAGVARAVERAGAESYAGIITYTDQGARIVAERSDWVTVIPGADDMGDIDRLAREGADAERLVIWTGISRGPVDEAFVEALGERDIPASGGALGFLDDRAEAGVGGVYAGLADAGIDIIATDRPVEAARALGIAQVAETMQACRIAKD